MLSDGRALLLTALLSIVIWVVNAAGVEAMFRAFSLELPVYASFLLLGVIAVALVLPSAPGYIGPFQAGTVQGLALMGVARETALSLSIVYHLGELHPHHDRGPRLPERAEPHPGRAPDGRQQERMSALAFSVVIPVYNEEDNVRPLLVSLQDVMESLGQPYELIVVDDGSTDATHPRLRDLTAELRALRIVQLRSNFGQTAALAAGFDLARGALIITLDGDGQNDPADIPRLVDKLKEGYDVVSGWRHDRQDPFWSRRLPSQVANALISWITGVRLHDYGCALKVYRREILQDVALYGEMHRFLPALCRWVGATVGELPVTHWPRRRGVSKYGLGRMVRVLLDLLTVKFLMSYSTRPIQIFGLLGLVLGGLGIGRRRRALVSEALSRDGPGQPAAPSAWRTSRSRRLPVRVDRAARRDAGPHLSRVPAEARVHGPRNHLRRAIMIRSSRLVRDVCLGLALLAAAGCGGGSSSSTSSSSQAPADFDFGSNNSEEGDRVRRQHHAGRPRAEAPGLPPHHPEQLPHHPSGQAPEPRPSVARGQPRGGGRGDSAGLRRLPSVLAIDKPGFVLILEGTNDAHECRDASGVTNNLQNMVRIAKTNQVDPDHRDASAELPEQPVRRRHHHDVNINIQRVRERRTGRRGGDLRGYERPLLVRHLAQSRPPPSQRGGVRENGGHLVPGDAEGDARRNRLRPPPASLSDGREPVAVLERVTLAEIQAVFAVTDGLGISREALVIPLSPGRPGRVRRLPSGKLEIILDADVPLAEWLEGLPNLIRAAGG